MRILATGKSIFPPTGKMKAWFICIKITPGTGLGMREEINGPVRARLSFRCLWSRKVGMFRRGLDDPRGRHKWAPRTTYFLTLLLTLVVTYKNTLVLGVFKRTVGSHLPLAWS